MNIDETLTRFNALFVGVNAKPIDRLHRGAKSEVAFYVALSKERDEMIGSLNVAAVSMQNMAEELADLRASVKQSGDVSMSLGSKRDPARDVE